jgi:U6 snRNA-associated Sm-like protein LSm8
VRAEPVTVITNDGRCLVGVLRGFDQAINVVLEDCHERVYSTNAGVEKVRLSLSLCAVARARSEAARSQVELGPFIVRGDNVAVVGALDAAADAELDLRKVRAEPLKPIKH